MYLMRIYCIYIYIYTFHRRSKQYFSINAKASRPQPCFASSSPASKAAITPTVLNDGNNDISEVDFKKKTQRFNSLRWKIAPSFKNFYACNLII